jgi:hypothetical protein
MGQAKTLKAAAAIQAVFTEELKVYQWPTTIPVTATYIPLEHVGVSPQGNPQSTYMANGKAVLSNLDLQATLGLLTCRMWACRLARVAELSNLGLQATPGSLRICTRLLPYKESNLDLQATLGLLTCQIWTCRLH